MIRSAKTAISSSLNLLRGVLHYAARGETPESAYQGMINLFCLTGGLSNDMLHGLVKLFRRPRRLGDASGILGELSRGEIERITLRLRTEGYYIFPRRLPEDICDRLVEFACTADCRARAVRAGESSAPIVGRFNRSAPIATRYDFDPQTLIENSDIQGLMADRSILSLAQAYLECAPILDIVTMWWITAFAREANSEAAQLFHFDMDRIKWLKIFIYLTDVDPHSGPHTFVAKSHQRNGIHRSLRKKGYARLTDAEVAGCYPPGDIKEFTGQRGTIIAEDTRGLHKGRHCERGDRLVFQLEFADSMFGGHYRKVPLRRIVNPSLAAMNAAHKGVFTNFGAE